MEFLSLFYTKYQLKRKLSLLNITAIDLARRIIHIYPSKFCILYYSLLSVFFLAFFVKNQAVFCYFVFEIFQNAFKNAAGRGFSTCSASLFKHQQGNHCSLILTYWILAEAWPGQIVSIFPGRTPSNSVEMFPNTLKK